MAANLPDTTDVFIPGQTVPDPPCIPEDRIECGFVRLEKLVHLPDLFAFLQLGAVTEQLLEVAGDRRDLRRKTDETGI